MEIRAFKILFLLAACFGSLEAKSRVPRLPGSFMKNLRMIQEQELNVQSRIVGGEEAAPNSIPYQVTIQDKNSGNFHYCGGAVIDNNSVLTAAHCCDGVSPDEIRIVAGEHNLYVDEGHEQVRDVSRVNMNENYNGFLVTSDICTLDLVGDLDFSTGKVDAVPLPEAMSEPLEGSLATLSGWGTLVYGDPASTPDTLYKVEVPIVSDDTCRQGYGTDIVDSMLCAGADGKDGCQGDSGGPLVCEDGTHCGVASWGYGCGYPLYPGVFTQTSYFVDWILLNS